MSTFENEFRVSRHLYFLVVFVSLPLLIMFGHDLYREFDVGVFIYLCLLFFFSISSLAYLLKYKVFMNKRLLRVSGVFGCTSVNLCDIKSCAFRTGISARTANGMVKLVFSVDQGKEISINAKLLKVGDVRKIVDMMSSMGKFQKPDSSLFTNKYTP